MHSKNRYPYGQQTLDKSDIDEVVQSLNAPLITGGELVEKFEKKIKDYTKSKHAVCCSSGTAALTLIFKALNVKKNSNILVPNITFNATAAAAKQLGCNIHICDVNSKSGLITPKTFLDALSKLEVKIDILVLVYLNGNSVEIDEIHEIASKNKIKIIADGCHALGTLYKDKLIGGGNKVLATTFSFHPVKAITTGEGGAIVTDIKTLADKVRLQRSHGINRDPANFKNLTEAYDINGDLNPWYYEIDNIGYNFRLTDFQCALGISQIKKLDSFINKRRSLANYYLKNLEPFSSLVTPVGNSPYSISSYHLFPILINFDLLSITRAKFMNKLAKKNIFTQVHYIPLNKFRCWETSDIICTGSLEYYNRVLSLPIYPSLKEDDIDYICKEIGEILENASKN